MEPLWPIVLAVILPILAFMLALIPYVRYIAQAAVRDVEKDVENLKGQFAGIEPSLGPLREISMWAQKRGLDSLLRTQANEPHSGSLPPEKMARRDYLTQMARTSGLARAEAAELQALLEEDARDDLARGVISFVAFVLILLGITALIKGLSEKSR